LASAFDWFARSLLSDFMLVAFGMFCVCVVIQVIASLAMPEPLKEESRPLVWEHWTEPLKARCGTGLSDYRIISAVVLATFLVLYIIFK
jgi:SSS family solute:Na+ symporter